MSEMLPGSVIFFDLLFQDDLGDVNNVFGKGWSSFLDRTKNLNLLESP